MTWWQNQGWNQKDSNATAMLLSWQPWNQCKFIGNTMREISVNLSRNNLVAGWILQSDWVLLVLHSAKFIVLPLPSPQAHILVARVSFTLETYSTSTGKVHDRCAFSSSLAGAYTVSRRTVWQVRYWFSSEGVWKVYSAVRGSHFYYKGWLSIAASPQTPGSLWQIAGNAV